MNIWLVGFMGSGKSTIGSLLAEELGFEFVDTDKVIESGLKMTIHHLFKKHGEMYFRSLERQLCLQLAQGTNQVIATGGGIPIHSFSMDEMKLSGNVIHLVADAGILWSRVETNKSLRPLVDSKKEFIELNESRQQFYQAADFTVDSSGQVDNVCMDIKRYLDSSA